MPGLAKIVKLIRSNDHKKVGKGLIDAAERTTDINDSVVEAVVYALGSKDSRVRQGCLKYLQCLVCDFATVALEAGMMKALGAIPHDDFVCIADAVSLIHHVMYLEHEFEDVASAVALLAVAIIQDVSADMAMVLACKLADSHIDVIVDALHITEVYKFFWTRGACLVPSLLLATAMCDHVRHFGADLIYMNAMPQLLDLIHDRVNVVYVCSLVQQMCKSGYVEEMAAPLNALLAALDDHDRLDQVFAGTNFNRDIFRKYVLITFSHAMEQCPMIIWRVGVYALIATCVAEIDFDSVDTIAKLLSANERVKPYADNSVIERLRELEFPCKLQVQLHEFPEGDRILNTWFPDFAVL